MKLLPPQALLLRLPIPFCTIQQGDSACPSPTHGRCITGLNEVDDDDGDDGSGFDHVVRDAESTGSVTSGSVKFKHLAVAPHAQEAQ